MVRQVEGFGSSGTTGKQSAVSAGQSRCFQGSRGFGSSGAGVWSDASGAFEGFSASGGLVRQVRGFGSIHIKIKDIYSHPPPISYLGIKETICQVGKKKNTVRSLGRRTRSGHRMKGIPLMYLQDTQTGQFVECFAVEEILGGAHPGTALFRRLITVGAQLAKRTKEVGGTPGRVTVSGRPYRVVNTYAPHIVASVLHGDFAISAVDVPKQITSWVLGRPVTHHDPWCPAPCVLCDSACRDRLYPGSGCER